MGVLGDEVGITDDGECEVGDFENGEEVAPGTDGDAVVGDLVVGFSVGTTVMDGDMDTGEFVSPPGQDGLNVL